MEEQIKGFGRAARAAQNAAKAVDAFWRVLPKGNVAVTVESAEKAVRALESAVGFDSEATALKAAISKALNESRQKLDRERALLAGAVAKKLAEAGLRVAGNLPVLTAGPYSLDFTFGTRGQCTLWLGPSKYRLASAPLDPDAIAGMVSAAESSFFDRNFDEHAFMSELEKAYRIATTRAGVEYGSRLPLSSVVCEIAFLRQKPAFLLDPGRESFIPYGRVEFAADLSRVRNRVVAGMELKLDVATMSQTKKPQDHIWIPRAGSVEGINFATMRFVKAAGQSPD